MQGLVNKFRLALRLGISSLVAYKLYQIKCRIGYFKRILPKDSTALGLDEAYDFSEISACELRTRYFFHYCSNLNVGVMFNHNPFTNHDVVVEEHWSDIKTPQLFEKPGEDVKVIWEASRFYWLLDMAISDNSSQKVKLCMNLMLEKWCGENPYNQGLNWLCAQEVSIRLVNYLLSMSAIGNREDRVDIKFVLCHAARIYPAMSYAMAQKNNHILSESLGLIYAGAWLSSLNKVPDLASKYMKRGRNVLERFLSKLVLSDGTFSQYSITYHCMVVEIVTLALWLQKKYKLRSFGEGFLQKSELLLEWLLCMVDPVSYDAPNMGSNDSTALYKIDKLPYRDFRSRLQALSVLLLGRKIYNDNDCNEILDYLCVDYEGVLCAPIQQAPLEHTYGGYVKFVGNNSWGLLNYPVFKFRPSQADCMHFDLWVSGINVLRDNGTYSYNSSPEIFDYFRGIEAHNSIQFDGKQPMPMVSRFLFSDWVKTVIEDNLTASNGVQEWCGYYVTATGAWHKRRVTCMAGWYVITDEIDKYEDAAVMRWHLNEDNWSYKINCWESSLVRIFVEVNGRAKKPVMYNSYESRHYHSKTKKPAIKVEIKDCPAIVVTRIQILV